MFPWFGSAVPITHAFVPVNLKLAVTPAFPHAEPCATPSSSASNVQLPSLVALLIPIFFRLVGSTVLPDDSTSNPFAALYTPTLQIFGVAFAPVILIRTAVPSTASLRHRRFAEIVAPFPKSCHLPVTSLYSTVKEEIVCPFWIYSSIETTSNFLIPFRLISRLPVVLPSSGAQYVSSYVWPSGIVSITLLAENSLEFPHTEVALAVTPSSLVKSSSKVSWMLLPNSLKRFHCVYPTLPSLFWDKTNLIDIM